MDWELFSSSHLMLPYPFTEEIAEALYQLASAV